MSVHARFLGIAGVEFLSPGGIRIVVDPCLSGDATMQLDASPIPTSDLDDTDLILVSHGARDHYGDTVEIAGRSGAIIGCAPDVRLKLLHDAVPPEQIRKLLPGVRWCVGDVVVKTLAACHISMHQVDDQWVTGPPLCFVIDLGGTKVFHAGDTALSAELRMLGELYRPDAAFIPVGATEPGLDFMPPDEAAIALQWVGARTAIPIHFPPGSGADRAFADAVAARGLDAHVEFMAPGATLEIPIAPTTHDKEP